jgi:hypothetical protein
VTVIWRVAEILTQFVVPETASASTFTVKRLPLDLRLSVTTMDGLLGAATMTASPLASFPTRSHTPQVQGTRFLTVSPLAMPLASLMLALSTVPSVVSIVLLSIFRTFLKSFA